MNGNYLDNVRLREGTKVCASVFRAAAGRDKAGAAAMLNSDSLKYPCLFVLKDDISSMGLKAMLSPRNKTALDITDIILDREAESARRLTKKNQAEYAALKWMLDTGQDEDGLSGDFDMVIDAAVSVLINVYKDAEVLPIAAGLIFRRGREGRNIHDLVWAYFRIQDPYALRLIAQYLGSGDPKETGLARNLLNIAEEPDNNAQYGSYIKWLDDNDPFLYFTGDSYQAGSEPVFYSVDEESKYLDRPINAQAVSRYDTQAAIPVSTTYSKSLAAFRSLDPEDKTLLSNYSHWLRKQNYEEWKTWMRYPADIQLMTAKAAGVFV